ncbi:gp53-like domain-containing protein, partial [Arsenophonus nasoniae]|uniref:gp53-like domain-containing protein n=1 Tax=Arsenophonus nasoniae TaxID=638 RepID=UPI00387A3201
NTLKKIAKALGNDPKFAETCNTIFAKKSSRDVLTSGRLIVTGGVDSKAPALQVKSTTTHGYLELIAANGNTWRIGSNNNDQRSYFEKVGKFSIYFPEKAGTLALISDVETRGAKNTANNKNNGYWRCGDTGIMFQWGEVNYSAVPPEGDVTIKFPIAYQNACLNAQATRKILQNSTGNSNDGGILAVDWTKSSFRVNLAGFNAGANNLRGFTWFAIGY